MSEYQPYLMKDVHQQSSQELFTVVSTFAGGGGSSTGYKLSGGKIMLANEVDPTAADTYTLNYPNTPVANLDIRKITRAGGRNKVLNLFEKFWKICKSNSIRCIGVRYFITQILV